MHKIWIDGPLPPENPEKLSYKDTLVFEKIKIEVLKKQDLSGYKLENIKVNILVEDKKENGFEKIVELAKKERKIDLDEKSKELVEKFSKIREIDDINIENNIYSDMVRLKLMLIRMLKSFMEVISLV